ncbi:MAG: DEAD/DEAH box helicase [Planctomycetaceae bacterium]|jgi:ATP-dependent helicase HepA|nr:DEAD/DEAH box helicase [Planctomycetaceae bacterium]
MIESYKRIIHGVQALRRWAELHSYSLLGATGVKAFMYPHQLWVVREVIKHTRIRHLLADEVGLGKTLESLMIMNVLRLQNGGKLRVSIVVGSEERAKQWTNEIRRRLHYPFWKNDVLQNDRDLLCNNNVFLRDELKRVESLDESDGFRIFYTQNFDAEKTYLEPQHCDLLILDEVHSFSMAILDFLARRSADYQNVLVLSATPLFGEEKDRLRLLQILAPDQAELFELQGENPTLDSIPILRSQRKDFPKALPQRQTNIRKCEPLESDILRYKKSRNLMQRLLKEDLVNEENAVLFLRRAAVGGQTLIDRVDEYRPRFSQYRDEFTSIRELCTPNNGDARFDELMDYLLDFFAEDSEHKIIITAQDNPTIDYLKEQIGRCLPEVGVGTNCKPLKFLQFRQERKQGSSDESESKDENDKEPAKDNKGIIDEFWNGDAQILLAHNDAKESFNLQIADALVFYSLPWKPVDMEQWLGRISRLGLRKSKTVEIVALVLRETVGEQIAEIYKTLNMFENPLDLEKNQNILNDIEQQINNIALWGSDFKNPKLSEEMETGLIQIVPQNEAKNLDDKVRDSVVQPVISPKKEQQEDKLKFPQEDALNEWIELLEKHKIIWKRTYDDDNFKYSKYPQYYKFVVMKKDWQCDLSLPCLCEEPIPEKPFILKRAHIQMPPRDLVPIYKRYNRDEQRYEVPLQFFNFGGQLHDELVNEFIKLLPQYLFMFRVYINDVAIAKGTYLIGIVAANRQQNVHTTYVDELTKDMEQNVTKTQQERRKIECRRLTAGLQADDRFFDLLFPRSLEIHCVRRQGRERWTKVQTDLMYPCLTQIPEIDKYKVKKIPQKLDKYFARLTEKSVNELWHNKDVNKEIEQRIDILAKELRISEELWQLKIEKIQQKINDLRTESTRENEDTIKRNYIPELKRLQEHLQLVRNHFEIRKKYLTQTVNVFCHVSAVLCLAVK